MNRTNMVEKKLERERWLRRLKAYTAMQFREHAPRYPSVVPMSLVEGYGFLRRIFQMLMEVAQLDSVYYPRATYLITDRNGIVVAVKQGETCEVHHFGRWSLDTVGVSALSLCLQTAKPALVLETEHDAPYLQEYYSFAFPIMHENELVGCFAFFIRPLVERPSVDPFTSLEHIATMVEMSLQRCCKEDAQIDLHQEISLERKYSSVLKELHEKLNVDEFLQRMVVELDSVLCKGTVTAGLLSKEGGQLQLAWHSKQVNPSTLHLSIQTQHAEVKELYQTIFHEQELVIHNRLRYRQLLLLFPGIEQLHFSSFILLPLAHEGELMGLVLVHSQQYLMITAEERLLLQRLMGEIGAILRQALTHQEVEQAVHKRDILYRVTQKLYSTFNLNGVLTTIMESIHQLYPQLHVDLYLTGDTFEIDFPVKMLQFSQEDQAIYLQAFMEGRVIHQEDGDGISLAIPLLGKQGSYGVFHVYSEPNLYLSEDEVAFITLLAETAGHAFENAQLYQQSRELIRELKIVNQITQELNRKLQLDEVLNYLVKKMASIFKADSIILQQVQDGTSSHSILASSLSIQDDIFEQRLAKVLANCFTSDEGIIQSDLACSVDGYTVCSLMAAPLKMDADLQCRLIVFSEQAFAFTFNDYQLFQLIAQHSSLAVNNAMLHQRLEQMVITDQLTQLYARHYLDEQISYSQENDGCGAFILIDIDDFKRVNDTYGHQIGDEVLRMVAAIVKANIRASDVAARWGGEELAIYLPHCELDAAYQVAERIRQCVEATTQPQVTLSIGVSAWKHGETELDPTALFFRADQALYEAKGSGKNQVIMQARGVEAELDQS